MMCVCGYEYESKYENEKEIFIVIKGDDDFIDLKGYFSVKSNTYVVNFGNATILSLAACPKCLTIRLPKL